jgi:5-methylcytosine-specific restriction endonuclease McrA
LSFFEREDWTMYKPGCVCADEAPGVKIIAAIIYGGRRNYYVQCVTSGQRGSAIAQSKLSEAERRAADINPIDLAREREVIDRARAERQREFAAEKESDRARWWIRYDEYLGTKEWAARRTAVLKRDNYVCQACLNRRAVQVHHTTYRHVFHEPLFDLVAVCIECHDRITELDRRGIPKEYREAS